MSLCKCNNIELFEIVFGLAIFLIILFAMQEHIILLFEKIELYRAVFVTLGGIVAAGTIGIVSSFSAVWIVQNIGKVITVASIVWAVRLIVV